MSAAVSTSLSNCSAGPTSKIAEFVGRTGMGVGDLQAGGLLAVGPTQWNRHPRLPAGGRHQMRTLHFGLRVADLDRSLAFYAAVGYLVVGIVPETPMGHLTMLKLPADEFVTIELVHDPSQAGAAVATGLSHFVINVVSVDATISALAAEGVDTEAPSSPDGSDHFRTTWIVDPDGNRIELVQWPPGHADGMTEADWAD